MAQRDLSDGIMDRRWHAAPTCHIERPSMPRNWLRRLGERNA